MFVLVSASLSNILWWVKSAILRRTGIVENVSGVQRTDLIKGDFARVEGSKLKGPAPVPVPPPPCFSGVDGAKYETPDDGI